jgi:hypothetical protein
MRERFVVVAVIAAAIRTGSNLSDSGRYLSDRVGETSQNGCFNGTPERNAALAGLGDVSMLRPKAFYFMIGQHLLIRCRRCSAS